MSRKKKKGRNIQAEKMIYHGDYMTVHVFPKFQKPGMRSRKSKPSSEVQKKLNQKNREENLTCKINENFNPGDLEIGLGFDDEHLPDSYEGVQRAVRNYIRRLKRYWLYNDLGEFKYIYVIEKGEKNGRWHVHMLLPGAIDRDELENLWGQGYAHTYRMEFDDDGFKGIAKYIIKEPETERAEIEGKVRRWAASKNLKKPVVKERSGYISKETTKEIREGNYTERELERLYKGYMITAIEPWYNDVNKGEYLTIRLRKIQTSRITKQVFHKQKMRN